MGCVECAWLLLYSNVYTLLLSYQRILNTSFPGLLLFVATRYQYMHCADKQVPQVKVCCLNYESTTNVASFPGHSQILSHSCGEPIFLHGCRIKFGSGLGTTNTHQAAPFPTMVKNIYYAPANFYEADLGGDNLEIHKQLTQ